MKKKIALGQGTLSRGDNISQQLPLTVLFFALPVSRTAIDDAEFLPVVVVAISDKSASRVGLSEEESAAAAALSSCLFWVVFFFLSSFAAFAFFFIFFPFPEARSKTVSLAAITVLEAAIRRCLPLGPPLEEEAAAEAA